MGLKPNIPNSDFKSKEYCEFHNLICNVGFKIISNDGTNVIYSYDKYEICTYSNVYSTERVKLNYDIYDTNGTGLGSHYRNMKIKYLSLMTEISNLDPIKEMFKDVLRDNKINSII